MPSPFPGMNPYLEKVDAWRGVHGRLCNAIAARLVAGTSDKYYVRYDEDVYVHEPSGDDRRRQRAGRPDVGVVLDGRRDNEPEPARAAGGTAVAPPVPALWPEVETEDVTFLELREAEGDRLVTVVEVLSPTNKKPGPDRDTYVAKRNAVLRVGANLVEIDLLRMYGRLPVAAVGPGEALVCDYLVLVARPADLPAVEAWPVRLRDRLPTIPVPLAGDDPDVPVDLQAVLHEVYDVGGFARFAYRRDPQPPLGDADAAWAADVLGGAGSAR